MHQYNAEMLVRLKQKEMEKKSNEAWKFAGFKPESLIQKISKKFSFTKVSKKKVSNQNNCVCSSKC